MLIVDVSILVIATEMWWEGLKKRHTVLEYSGEGKTSTPTSRNGYSSRKSCRRDSAMTSSDWLRVMKSIRNLIGNANLGTDSIVQSSAYVSMAL